MAATTGLSADDWLSSLSWFYGRNSAKRAGGTIANPHTTVCLVLSPARTMRRLDHLGSINMSGFFFDEVDQSTHVEIIFPKECAEHSVKKVESKIWHRIKL